jgi:hypothetical protein
MAQLSGRVAGESIGENPLQKEPKSHFLHSANVTHLSIGNATVSIVSR